MTGLATFALVSFVSILLVLFAYVTIKELLRLGREVPDPQDRTSRNLSTSVSPELFDEMTKEQEVRLQKGRRDSTLNDIMRDALKKYFTR